MKNKLLWLLLLIAGRLWGNNIAVNNMFVTSDNPAQGYALVQFDLSWSNSWRTSSAPSNWDAAWVFVKFRTGAGAWSHALLNNTGHSAGSGTSSTIETGLLDDNATFDASTNPGIGVLVYRSSNGTGAYSATGMQLRWNYTASGISSLATVTDIRVFAIEMVLVPGGSFYIGDGSSDYTFRQVPSNVSFQVTSTGAPVKINLTNSNDDDQIEGTGIWVDGDEGVSKSAASATDMNPLFPTGYRGFYCMKYEISQGQYRDFLNTLTRVQQNTRTETDISPTSIFYTLVMTGSNTVGNRNGIRCDANLLASTPITVFCDQNNNGDPNDNSDGEWDACNYLSADDGNAYLDWSGLRPMTELEYEKACRGPAASVSNEFAWGTTGIVTPAYAISNPGAATETVYSNYSTALGNASYYNTASAIGPLRVGIFAGHASNTGRVTSGAGYSGAMELSGNLWEQFVTLGKVAGRSYTGLHGNGVLSSSGNADVSLWPTPALGFGLRGGSWYNPTTLLRVSDRATGAGAQLLRSGLVGFRGGRSVSPSGGGY